MDIVQVKNENDIRKLAELAHEIWHEYFPSIISNEQINYMLDKFQSEHALTLQIKEGYQYFFIENSGYLGFQTQDDKLFLSKLYIKKTERGKGFARLAFEFLKIFCKKQNLNSIYLTVNKYNNDTIAIYKKFGFIKTDSVVNDIGNNYVMDDYILEYVL